MTNSVTFPPALGGDGNTYTDDANATTGLDGYGWKTRFVPCLSNTVIMAQSSVTNATAAATSATNAAASATAAASSATAAATSATNAANSATAAAASAASIAGGPVASWNGLTGIVSAASTNLTDGAKVLRAMRQAKLAFVFA